MKNCSICKKSLSFLEGKKLSNGSHICKACVRRLPDMAQGMISHLNEYDIKKIYEYTDKANGTFKDAFIKTASYGDLHIDEMHGLFVICKSSCIDKNGKIVKEVKDIYHCLNLSNISITMVPDKGGRSGNRIKGSVSLVAVLENPQININTVIKKNAWFDTSDAGDGYVRIEEPNDLKIFKSMFNRMIESSALEYEKKKEKKRKERERERMEEGTQNRQENENDIELMKAMAVFMLEGDGYSKKDIRSQRNLLLKTYHPDEGNLDSSEHAKKINHYYEVLVRHMEESK